MDVLVLVLELELLAALGVIATITLNCNVSCLSECYVLRCGLTSRC